MISILKLNCPDAVGLLAQITGAISRHGGNLLEVSQYTDVATGWFFARLAIEKGHEHWDADRFVVAFAPLASQIRATWSMRSAASKTRTVILVSKQTHCLVDLLWRWRSGELGIEVPLVISNHETCRLFVEREQIPFELILFSKEKSDAFEILKKLLEEANAELIVLARFMQILPDWLCRLYAGRIINIHHSFLPAFVGANPYQRAFERGVKLIGATCHYATEELDAGPIIEQEVARVEHYHEPDDLVRLGRDCERLALARGVRYHVEDRVLVHGAKAIVFRD
ncbi:MAG TPA: formyltetrahydrofolate deformylase [Terrimicrobiaceae bacterium]